MKRMRTHQSQQRDFLTPVKKQERKEPKPRKVEIEVIKPKKTTLRFSPSAFSKIVYFRDNEDRVEISGFGISNLIDPLLIEDFCLIKQKSEMAYTEMDDNAVADFMAEKIQQGFEPHQFMRVWIHTHPGNEATPSGKDRQTFESTLGNCDWSVMFILSQGGEMKSYLHISNPAVIEQEIPTSIAWDRPIFPLDYEELAQQYIKLVDLTQSNITSYPKLEKVKIHSPSTYLKEKEADLFPYATNYYQRGWEGQANENLCEAADRECCICSWPIFEEERQDICNSCLIKLMDCEEENSVDKKKEEEKLWISQE